MVDLALSYNVVNLVLVSILVFKLYLTGYKILKIGDCRGQRYDGASIMSGKKSGVAQRIKLLTPKCLYTHCYGHAFNLCVKDSCDRVELIKDCFSATKLICNLVKNSPQRETMLKSIRAETKNSEKLFMHFVQPGGLYEAAHLKVL